MAEYIEREAVYTAFANAGTDVLERASKLIYIAGFSYEHVIEILDDIPVTDVAPVVRCKDCKHYEIHKPKVLENCERNGHIIPMKPDDFCSYGERKDGDD